MKQIKLLLAGFLMISSLALFAQGPSPYLTWRLADPVILDGGANPDTLQFTVEVKCDVMDTYQTDLTLYLDYNTTAFGSGIVAAGGIVIEKTGLTGGELLPGFPFYNLLPIADNTTSKVAFGTEAAFTFPYNISTLNMVDTDYLPAFIVKMVIVDNTVLAGITFDDVLMSGSQFYVLDPPAAIPSQYGDNGFDGDLSNFPLFDVELMMSEIADPETPAANAKFVEIYNPMATVIDFSFVDIYLNKESNGGPTTDSVKLTGTLAPGGTYTVAFNPTDFQTAYGFAPDLDGGFAASGNGDDSYILTSGGGLFTGTLIDIFGELGVDGTDEEWEYTDTKAVRKFDVTAPNATFTLNEWVIGPKGFNPGSGSLVAFADDMTPGTHRGTVTWDGSSSQDWRDKTNWTPEYIPDAAHNVVITTAPGAEVDEDTYAYCNDLTIGGARAGAYLTILSTPTGDGSLVTFGTVTGNADVEKYLPADRWNYITPPVTGALADVFLHTWMYTYDETTGEWGAFIVPETTPLDEFRGYADWTSSINEWSQFEPPLGDTTTMYNNLPLNFGPYSETLAYGSGSQGDGYNFMGNPYVASIDWEAPAGWDKSGLASDGFVIWEGSMNAQYVSGTGGTNGASRYIPPQQGFFVQTIPAGGTFGLDDDVKVHSEQDFLKDEQIVADRLSLTITNGQLTDETVIHFNVNATAGKDFSYDSDKYLAPTVDYNPDGTVLRVRNQIYSVSDNVKRAINTFNNINETPAVTVGILVGEEGELTINALNIESFDATTPIFLEDQKEELFINLRDNSSYTFTASPEDDENRFKVHFADPLGIDDPANTDVYSIYAYNKDVYVNFNGDRGEIVIYNVMGQEVYRSVAAKGLNKITLVNGNAAYIVKVVSDNSVTSEKVFIR